jgi:hypothetical protein
MFTLIDLEVARLATLVLIHGAGDSAWYWHLLEPKLRDRGHDVSAELAAEAVRRGRHQSEARLFGYGFLTCAQVSGFRL